MNVPDITLPEAGPLRRAAFAAIVLWRNLIDRPVTLDGELLQPNGPPKLVSRSDRAEQTRRRANELARYATRVRLEDLL